MPIAKVDSLCLSGVEAALVQVEVSLAKGLPSFSIVGLPDAAIREAKDRVVAAIRNSGFKFPSRRVTVNLAPADVRKEGASFDLAIAVGILTASEAIQPKRWPRCYWLGELALDGALRPVRGALSMGRSLARRRGAALALPQGNLQEVSCLPELKLFPFKCLKDVSHWLVAEGVPEAAHQNLVWAPDEPPPAIDMADIKGQAVAKRALEISAAGRHHMLMMGTPGTGKSMLAQAMPGILPSWTLSEALDATQVHSAAGELMGEGLLPLRPFRSPHHTVSTAALLGGGDIPTPGEISLAHRGVLFMDELPEFKREALEALRQPLEQGMIHIQRVRGRMKFPADVLMIGAMNPCPCGYQGHPKRECECTPYRIQRYRNKVSGPVLDRVDIQVELPALKLEELFQTSRGCESSAQVRERVQKARRIQDKRYEHFRGRPRDNAHLLPKELSRYCALSSDGEAILKAAVEQLGLSARAFDRIKKVARTIADLEGCASIEARHIAEVIQYRCLDRKNIY